MVSDGDVQRGRMSDNSIVALSLLGSEGCVLLGSGGVAPPRALARRDREMQNALVVLLQQRMIGVFVF